MTSSNGSVIPEGFQRERVQDVELAYAPGSHASQVKRQFGSHANQVLRASLKLLQAPARLATSPRPIVIVCRESLDDGSTEAWSDPELGVVTVVLSPSIPAYGLTRELASVILYRVQAQGTSTDVAERSVAVTRPEGLSFVIGGVARAIATRVEAQFPFSSRPSDEPPADEVCREIAAQQEWKLPVYECLVGGPEHAPTNDCYWPIAESFGNYLLTRDGPKAFREFLGETAGGDISYAAAVAYGKYIEGLTSEWIDFQLRLRRGRRPMGWMAFLRRSMPYFRPYPWLVAWCIALVFVTSITAQYTPFAFRDILDTPGMREVPDEPFRGLVSSLETVAQRFGIGYDDTLLVKSARIIRLVLVLFAVNIVSLGTQIMLVYYVNVLGQNVLRDLRLRYVDRVNGLSASNFNRTSTGDLQARFLSDLVRLADPMTQIVSYSVYHIVFLISVIWAMFLLAWQLTLVLLAVVPLYILIAAWLGPKLQAAIRARQERLAQLNSDLKQMVDAHPLIQIGNLQHFLRRRAEPGIEHSRRVEIRSDFYTGVFSETVTIVDQFFQKSVLLVGGLLAVFAILTIGTVSAFLTQTSRGIARLHSLTNMYRHIALASAVLQRVEEVLAYGVETIDKERVPSASGSKLIGPAAIEFDHVWFSYNGADQILRDVTLSVPAGGKVAFVGPTGAGKTTLVNMVPRFYDPSRGHVRINGIDTTELTLPELRGRIGLVSQDTFLFNMTIRENIGLGKLGASDEEIEAAAKRARIHDFVMSLPSGYHTLVGERGSRLSGGQRQRLAVARALLRNPSILILDEATSALDAETEREILDELDEVTRDKTVLSITHRLALAMRAERIYVVDEGEIVEQGTHDELMAQRGIYRKLFEDQNELILSAIEPVGAAQSRKPVALMGADQDVDLGA